MDFTSIYYGCTTSIWIGNLVIIIDDDIPIYSTDDDDRDIELDFDDDDYNKIMDDYEDMYDK